MDQIILLVESDCKLDTNTFCININDKAVSYSINEDHTIVIDNDIVTGINLLNITLITDDCIVKIKDFILNKVSSRHTLYMSFNEINNVKSCSTWLTHTSRALTIPFGNPISWWLSECSKKIANDCYGSNLYNQYEIYYPEATIIPNTFPKIMQDFMYYNLGFHVHRKDELATPLHNKNIPFVHVDINYNEELLLKEFSDNVELLNNNYYKPKQNEYNSKESDSLNLWQVAMIVKPPETVSDTDWKNNKVYTAGELPLLHALLDDITAIGGIRIMHAFIGQVRPNSYVAQHVDDFYRRNTLYANADGCSQFFIPIGWTTGNYFKFNDIGLVPYEQGALIVNNSEFTHGSINASNVVRFTIGIVCEFTNDNICNFIKK